HCQVTQGLLKVMEKGGHRLWLSSLPGVTKHLRPPPNLALDIRRVNLARIGQDSLLTRLFGLTTWRRRGRPSLAYPLPIVQVIRNVFDLVEDAALMRHPIQMAVERLFEPLAPVTDDQLGGLFRHPLGIQGSDKRAPGGSILLGDQVPQENLPMPIWPETQGGQHHALLFAFDGALSPTTILGDLPSGHGQFEPQTIDQHNRRWRRK